VTKTVPPRLLWAVEQLAIEPDDRLLEIGCGGGVAVSLICDRLDEGRITAIDPSAVMVERAARRNEQHVASGKATIRLGRLEDLDFDDGSFTKVFAINVNLFWTRSPARELEIIRRLLTKDGELYLFYSPPSAARVDPLAEQLVTALSELGFSGATVETAEAGDSAVLCVRARPVVRS
jgi:ubiquinone/menaquinone biosynthesis C-methylase UbiE